MLMWVMDRIAVYDAFPGDFLVLLCSGVGIADAANAVFGAEKGVLAAIPPLGWVGLRVGG